MEPPPDPTSMSEAPSMSGDRPPSSFSTLLHGFKKPSTCCSSGDADFVHSINLHDHFSLQSEVQSSIFDDSLPNDSKNVNSLSIGALESENMDVPSSITENDVTSYFQTKSIFSSREELIDWARKVGRSLSYVVTILAHCRKLFSKGSECDQFLGKWNRLMNAKTEVEFQMEFNMLLISYAEKYPKVFSYVINTWIEPFKEYFISAWIDKFLHLGNATTNRVEGGHALLKKFLEVSIGNLTTVWKKFDQMITIQHTEIKRSFGQSVIQVSTSYTGPLYTTLVGCVSLAALKIIKEEEDKVKAKQFSQAWECSHKTRFSLGLPCAHELVQYINQSTSFPLCLIHQHWKQLSLKNISETQTTDDIASEFQGICRRFNETSSPQRKEIKRKLREIMDPTSTQTREPTVPLSLKGRPRGSYKKLKDDPKSTKREPSLFEHVLEAETLSEGRQYRKKTLARKRTGYFTRTPTLTSTQRFYVEVCKQLPIYLAEHIKEVINVIGDGHCGYRVVARALEMGDNWAQVRLDLTRELKVKEYMYVNLYGKERWQELLDSLDCPEIPAPPNKWMSMPDMGLVVASCYNIAFVLISKVQSLTFFPLNSPPPATQRLVAIGYIDGNHFVQLVMHEGSPLPHIVSYWGQSHDPIASEWERIYKSRLLIPNQEMYTQNEIVNLDDLL